MIKSRRMRWVGHLAHMGEIRNACRFLSEMTEGNIPLGISRLIGTIILKWILGK
jgi:hypothetical protein